MKLKSVIVSLENAAATEKSDEWKMLFTCRNKTTNEIVVMPKKSRAVLDQIIFQKMLGVDACKIMKFKRTDAWKLVKLPFTNHLKPMDGEIDNASAVFVDLPQEKLPAFDLVNVSSPFNYLDREATTTITPIESNIIN